MLWDLKPQDASLLRLLGQACHPPSPGEQETHVEISAQTLLLGLRMPRPTLSQPLQDRSLRSTTEKHQLRRQSLATHDSCPKLRAQLFLVEPHLMSQKGPFPVKERLIMQNEILSSPGVPWQILGPGLSPTIPGLKRLHPESLLTKVMCFTPKSNPQSFS